MMTITSFPLHPAASKFIIAQAVVQLPEVQAAFKNGRIFIATGTSNIAIAQQLLDKKFEPAEAYVAGIITQQVACATDAEQRVGPWCLDQGKLLDIDWLDFVKSLGPGDLFIKGANAVDPYGNIGILLADSEGGTIGKSIGILKARGIQIISPVGLEKMIPSCREAEKMMGIYKNQFSLGLKCGYMLLENTTLITEIESLKILMGIDAVQVAAGGVGGMEGSVFLAAQCKDEEQSRQLMNLVKKANKMPPLKISKKKCSDCATPCQFIEK